MKCLMELDNPRFNLTWKEKLAYLGFKFSAQSEDLTKCPVTHSFTDTHYVREMFIPKETLFIGRPHLHGHRCELVSGKILLITEQAKTHMEAPAELWSKPGYMMCLYSKTDVVGRTYHPIADLETFGFPAMLVDEKELERQIFGSIEELLQIGEQVRKKIHAIEGKVTV